MKKALIVLVLATLIGGCATAKAPQLGMRYELDGSGNMVQRQYVMPTAETSACVAGGINWCIAALIGVGVVVGVYGLDRIYSKNNNETTSTTTNTIPLVPSGGSSSTQWSSDFIAPVYTTVN